MPSKVTVPSGAFLIMAPGYLRQLPCVITAFAFPRASLAFAAGAGSTGRKVRLKRL
jgi:hypothetical protein